MEFITKIKCAFTSRQSLKDYYHSLSTPALLARKKTLLTTYLVTSLAWSSTLLVTVFAAKISGALLILYAGVVLYLLITTFIDYRNRLKVIDKIIASREEIE